jgi:hypothetical protein
MNDKWKKLRKAIGLSLLGATVLGMGLSFWAFGPLGALVTAIAALCLALGFWITENLVGCLAGVKKANATAIALLFLGKLAWWVALFALARVYPRGMEFPIAIGIGAFLLALLIGGVSQYGWPKISDS